MATPIGTILAFGMLGMGTAVLLVATVVTSFVKLPEEAGAASRIARPAEPAVHGRERLVTTAV